MPTDLPERKGPSAGAVALEKAGAYLAGAVVHGMLCASVALCVMVALNIMHDQVPATPPLGFMFLWAAVWGTSVLGVFAATIVKNVMDDDE